MQRDVYGVWRMVHGVREAYLEGVCGGSPGRGERSQGRAGGRGAEPLGAWSPRRPGAEGSEPSWEGGAGDGLVHPVPSLGCWPAIPGAGDRCPASPRPPPEWGQLAWPPRASVRFQAGPLGNFDLERMRVTDLAVAHGLAVSLRPGLGCPRCLPAPGTPAHPLGLRGHRTGFSRFLSLPCSVHLCPVPGPYTPHPAPDPHSLL